MWPQVWRRRRRTVAAGRDAAEARPGQRRGVAETRPGRSSCTVVSAMNSRNDAIRVEAWCG
ncbi:UNVERIFIED_CONTAM: hypothetical protein Sradi_4030100 [Sesamum radiatum]|uniref:Uncharacterized protein n=1 Tax=Sesamum radiatum TaxID=300843 RepID=A0AAW2PHY6_SESRA